MFDYEAMTEPKEPKEEPKGEGKEKEKKDEPKSDGPPKKDDAPGGPPKESNKVEHFEENLKMLKDDFNVDMPKDTTEKNFQEKLHAVLTALKHATGGAGGAGGGEGGATGGGSKPGEIELKPEMSGGGMQYSLANAQKDIEALKAEIVKRERDNLELSKTNDLLIDLSNKQQFSLIQTDLDKHQKLGHCTKADVEDWMKRIHQVAGTSRFSVLRPADSTAMVGIFAEIKQMKKVPDGTYTDGSTTPSRGGVQLVPEGETTEERAKRLSLNGNGDATEQEKVEASRNYFHDKIWPQLGIEATNGNGKK